MAFEFFKSTDIKVFPCAYRGKRDDLEGVYFNQESIIQSEFNFTNTSNKHWKNSYIISYANKILKCVIEGYYFEISKLTLPANDLYLYIALADKTIGSSDEKTTVLSSLNPVGINADEYLDAKDDDGIYRFYGLAYSTTQVSGAYFKLKVFENGQLCYANKLPEIMHGATDKSTVLPGATDIDGTLTVDGATALNNGLAVKNDITIENGKLKVGTGATIASEAIEVDGTGHFTGKLTADGGLKITGDTNIEGSTIKINTTGTQDAPNSNNITIGSEDNYTGTTTIYGSINMPSAIDIDWDSKEGKLTIKRGLNYPATNN